VGHAVASGHVGAGSDTVSASANSMFAVSGSVGNAFGPGDAIVAGSAPPNVQVLGTTTTATDNLNILLALLVLILLIPEYVLYRSMRDRRLVRFILASDAPWHTRFRAVTMLLL